MKKFWIILMILSFASSSFADCDYSKIVKNTDNTYTYSKQLHICVGEMKQDNGILTEQNDKLTKALTLKDLTITTADQRADMWKTSTLKLEDRMVTIDQMQKKNEWLMFGLGVLTTFAAGYAAAKLAGH